MSTTLDLMTEADVLDQLVIAEQPGLTSEASRGLLSIRFSPDAIRKMNELAEKNRHGTLSEAERVALERYRRVGQFLNLVQAKARGGIGHESPG